MRRYGLTTKLFLSCVRQLSSYASISTIMNIFGVVGRKLNHKHFSIRYRFTQFYWTCGHEHNLITPIFKHRHCLPVDAHLYYYKSPHYVCMCFFYERIDLSEWIGQFLFHFVQWSWKKIKIAKIEKGSFGRPQSRSRCKMKPTKMVKKRIPLKGN